jgi:hypothetical protein
MIKKNEPTARCEDNRRTFDLSDIKEHMFMRHPGEHMRCRGAHRAVAVAMAVAAAVAAMAVACAVASAETLPDVSVALGGSYPIHSQFSNNEKTKSLLEDTSGNRLESTGGLAMLMLMAELSSLGTYTATFSKVKTESRSCSTSGDASGVILVSGTGQMVLLAGKTTLGVLYLQPKVTIECEGVKVKVEGSALSSLQSTGTESTELSQLGGILKGAGKGKAELTKYINDSGTESAALLLANFGTGLLESDESVEEEVTATALEGKMFVISPR